MKDENNTKFIGLDLDGVIINHTPIKIKLAKEFGLNIQPKETHSEIINKFFSESDYLKFKRILYHDPKFFKKAPLMAGAARGLAAIKKNGISFVLISRRQEPEAAVEALKYYKLWPKFFSEKTPFSFPGRRIKI